MPRTSKLGKGLCPFLLPLFVPSSNFFLHKGAPSFYASKAVQELALRLLLRKKTIETELVRLGSDCPFLPETAPPFLTPKVKHLETFLAGVALDRTARLLAGGEDQPLLCYFTALSVPPSPPKELAVSDVLETVGVQFSEISSQMTAMAETLNRHTFLLEETEERYRKVCRRIDRQTSIISNVVLGRKDWKTTPKSSRGQEEVGKIKRTRHVSTWDLNRQPLFNNTYAEFCVDDDENPVASGSCLDK